MTFFYLDMKVLYYINNINRFAYITIYRNRVRMRKKQNQVIQGYTGLANLGNTCFLNSCIQIIRHTTELSDLLDSAKIKKLKKEIDDRIILDEWNELRKLMRSNNGVISPNKFVHNIHEIARTKDRDIFTGYAQNDMSEFLLFFVDCIHNSISRPIQMRIRGDPENLVDKIAIKSYEMLQSVYQKEYSEIMGIMYGVYVTTIRPIVPQAPDILYSIHPEHFFILDLQLFNERGVFNNIYQCFDHFISPEVMEGENAWLNDSTSQKENVTKSISFWNMPDILVVTFKRFLPDGIRKLENRVDFPLVNLDLSKYVVGYNPSTYVYDLYGVCNHMGGTMGGHYTAYVKNSADIWVHYNDSNVDQIEDLAQIISPSAYCLFYRKKNKSV